MLWKDTSAAACETILRHKLMPTPVPVQSATRFVEKYQLSSINIGLSSGADYNHGNMSPAPSVEAIQTIARQLPSGPLLYNYTADEIVEFPDLYPVIKAWARNLHSAGNPQSRHDVPSSRSFSMTDRAAVDRQWTFGFFSRATMKRPHRMLLPF